MTIPTPIDDDGANRAPGFDHLIDYNHKSLRFENMKAALLPANKAKLYRVLSAGGIATVVVYFDGCGDNGQIESVDALDTNG